MKFLDLLSRLKPAEILELIADGKTVLVGRASTTDWSKFVDYLVVAVMSEVTKETAYLQVIIMEPEKGE